MLGVITEYNPFHNGHKLHIQKSKEKTNNNHCIVVMSGNFCQRGEPAIFDKYTRTKMALLNGADLVLELPLCFATASAEMFALGAIDILDKTGVVKNICFGSEEGDINSFLEIVNILSDEPLQFKNYLNHYLNEGLSFPKARQQALEKFLNKKVDVLNEPNNILSIEYLKAINKLNSKICAQTIKREKVHFHSNNIDGNIASATAIRQAILNKDLKKIQNVVPKNCYDLMKNTKIKTLDNYTHILKYILKTQSLCYIQNIADITEGIENKIIDNIDSQNITHLITNIKSKRYTHTKLQRAILHIILNITKDEQNFLKQNLNQYIRVLGFKKSASHILTEIVQKAKVPVVTNLKNAKNILNKNAMYYLEKEIKCSDIYYLDEKTNQEYKKPLVIV